MLTESVLPMMKSSVGFVVKTQLIKVTVIKYNSKSSYTHALYFIWATSSYPHKEIMIFADQLSSGHISAFEMSNIR